MNDLTLINLPSPWLINDRVEAPLGLLYLASSVIKNGFKCEIVDLSGGGVLRLPESRYYGIGFVSPQFVYAKSVLEKIKKRYPDTPVIAGGIHATVLPDEVLEAGFDCVVRGEGEYSVDVILNFGINRPIYDHNACDSIEDCYPAWNLIDLESYLKTPGVVGNYLTKKREINIMGTRGCRGQCIYCTMYKGPFRKRPVHNIIKEILYLRDNYNVERFFFVDDNLIIDKDWLLDLCFQLEMNQVEWHCLGRADMLDGDKASAMSRAGCTGIDFGIETGSQRILDLIKKNCTVVDQEQGIANAYHADLKVRCQMMVGLPQETYEDIKLTKDFVQRNSHLVAKWGIHTFVPFPGCAVWANPEKYGYEINKDTDFKNYQTIGKPGVWNFTPKNNIENTQKWRTELLTFVGRQNIFE